MAVGITQQRGQEAEDRACGFLQAQGLRLLRRNYRLAAGPGRRGGEIDLIMRDESGTLVFVEVRLRSGGRQGGAAASVTWLKQRRIVRAAQHFLLSWPGTPACRFDLVAIDGVRLQWCPGAFEA